MTNRTYFYNDVVGRLMVKGDECEFVKKTNYTLK